MFLFISASFHYFRSTSASFGYFRLISTYFRYLRLISTYFGYFRLISANFDNLRLISANFDNLRLIFTSFNRLTLRHFNLQGSIFNSYRGFLEKIKEKVTFINCVPPLESPRIYNTISLHKNALSANSFSGLSTPFLIHLTLIAIWICDHDDRTRKTKSIY